MSLPDETRARDYLEADVLRLRQDNDRLRRELARVTAENAQLRSDLDAYARGTVD